MSPHFEAAREENIYIASFVLKCKKDSKAISRELFFY